MTGFAAEPYVPLTLLSTNSLTEREVNRPQPSEAALELASLMIQKALRERVPVRARRVELDLL